MKVLKVLGIVLLILLCLIVIFVILMVNLFGKINTSEQKDQEKVLGSGDKKALILYQESRGSLVMDNVNQITDALQAKGYQITMNHPRHDHTYIASDFDLVVLATPVYAGTIAQPIIDYADSQDFSGVNVFLLVTGKVIDKNEVEVLLPHIQNASAVDGIKTGQVEEETIHKLMELCK